MKTIPLLLLLLLCACSEHPAAKIRPPTWAQPLHAAGVSNFHQITATLYRGEQPTAEGMRELQKLGIKTVINLRAFHDDDDEIGTTALRQEHISFKTWHPEREDILKFLQLVTEPTNAPIFFHCQHGSDRTGTMTALYRITIQGWPKADAIREMKEGGYGFHEIWSNLAKWIEAFDVESLKKEVQPK